MKIAVAGAGIGGLTVAYRLQQLGHEVEVIEASGQAGGRIQTLKRNGDTVEVGAQFLHSGYVATRSLIDEMGLSGKLIKNDGDMLFHLEDGSVSRFSQNRPWLPVLGLRGNLKVAWLLIRYVFFGRKFDKYEIDRDIPEYDNKSARDLVKGAFEEELVQFFLEPLLLAPPDGTSLYQAVRWLRCSVTERLMWMAGGLSQLTEAVAERLAVRYDSPVKTLVMDRDQVVGVELSHGEIVEVDHVVVATEPPATARLLPDALAEQREFFEGVVPTVRPLPVFFLDDGWTTSTKWFGHINKPSRRHDVMYVFNPSTSELAPSGNTILVAWLGIRARDDMFDRSDEEIIASTTVAVEEMMPGFSKHIEHTEVVRHPYVETEFEEGAHRRVLQFLENSKNLNGVSFVGDLFGGCFIEGAVRRGDKVAAQIHAGI